MDRGYFLGGSVILTPTHLEITSSVLKGKKKKEEEVEFNLDRIQFSQIPIQFRFRNKIFILLIFFPPDILEINIHSMCYVIVPLFLGF